MATVGTDEINVNILVQGYCTIFLSGVRTWVLLLKHQEKDCIHISDLIWAQEQGTLSE